MVFSGIKINGEWLRMDREFSPTLERSNSAFHPGEIIGIVAFNIDIPIKGNEITLNFKHLIELPENYVAFNDAELWMHGRQYVGQLVFHRSQVEKSEGTIQADFATTTFPVDIDKTLITELDLPTYNIGETTTEILAAAKAACTDVVSPFRFPVYRNDAFYKEEENPYLFLNPDGTPKDDPAIYINRYDTEIEEFSENEFDPENYSTHYSRTAWKNRTTLVPWFHYLDVLKAVVEALGYTPLGTLFQHNQKLPDKILIANNYSIGGVKPHKNYAFVGNYDFEDYLADNILEVLNISPVGGGETYWENRFDMYSAPAHPNYPPWYELSFPLNTGIFSDKDFLFIGGGGGFIAQGDDGMVINVTARVNVWNINIFGTPASGTVRFLLEVRVGASAFVTLTHDEEAGTGMHLFTAHFFAELDIPDNTAVYFRFLMPQILSTEPGHEGLAVIRDHFCEVISMEDAVDGAGVNTFTGEIAMKNHLPEKTVSELLVDAKDLFCLDITADANRKTMRFDFATQQLNALAHSIDDIQLTKVSRVFNPSRRVEFKFRFSNEMERKAPKTFLDLTDELVGQFNWKLVPPGTFLYNSLTRQYYLLGDLDMLGSDWLPTMKAQSLGTAPVNHTVGQGEEVFTVQPRFNPMPVELAENYYPALSENDTSVKPRLLVPVLNQYGSKPNLGIIGEAPTPLIAVWHGLQPDEDDKLYPFASPFSTNSKNEESSDIAIMWNKPEKGLFDLFWKQWVIMLIDPTEFEVQVITDKTRIDEIFRNKKIYAAGQNYIITDQEEKASDSMVTAALTVKKIPHQ